MSQLSQLFQYLVSIDMTRWYWLVVLGVSLMLWVKIIRSIISSSGSDLSLSQNLKPIRKPIFLQASLITVLILISAHIFLPAPDIISPTLPMFDSIEITADQPLVIQFDRPISRQVQPQLYPAIPGTWHYSSSQYILLPDTLTFIPDQSPQLNTEYSLSIDRVLPISWVSLKQAKKILFVFHTHPLTNLASLAPSNQAKEINPTQPIVLTFDRSNSDDIEWTYQISPGIINQIEYNQDSTQLIIHPQGGLNPSTKYDLQIFRQPLVRDLKTNEIISTGAKELVSTSNFSTASHASIVSISPSGEKTLPNQPIVINFKHVMNQQLTQTAFSISPQTPGIFSWQGSQLTFTPQDFWQYNTQYSLGLDQSAQTLAGGSLSEKIEHTFKTVGDIQVLSSKPLENSNHPTTEPISITFDQPVNHASAQKYFTIEPKTPGTFSWNQNTLTFNPSSELINSQSYKISFQPGIVSTFGTKTVQSLDLNFTTIPRKFELDIPLYKQHHTFTCFTVATQMALTYKGVTSINEVGFLDEIGIDSTSRNFSSNTWGDPNIGVVGSYDGSGAGGYGVHWQPVANAISKYRPAEVKRNWNQKELLTQVSMGNPVMVWWVNGVWPAKDTSWKNSKGESIFTVNGMHVEVVRGWVGDINNPEYILTNDPWRGQRQYTPQQFQNLWKWFSNTAVIVS